MVPDPVCLGRDRARIPLAWNVSRTQNQTIGTSRCNRAL